MQAFTPGMQVSHFRLVEKIGSGATGDVFRAEDVFLSRPVALKILSRLKTPEQRERFLQEAQICSSLVHPNIALLYEAGWHEDAAFLALEFVEGRTLSQEIRSGQVDLTRALHYMRQILDALQAAHSRGIIHRDIKSSNILIASGGRVKILDFGLARDLGAISPQTELGTIEFLAPEQIRGEPADPRSDLYSAGVVLFQMLTGQLPFQSEQTVGMIEAVLNKTPSPLRSFLPDVSDTLERIVQKGIARSPENRYQSARDFSNDLQQAAAMRHQSGFASKAEQSLTVGPVKLAVLYFDHAGKQEQGEYLRLGITEDVITDLSKVAGIHVLSRHAVQKFKDKQRQPRAVLQDLNVDYILDGNVEQYSDRIRITAALLTKPDGNTVWSETYEREMRDIFELQDEVASSIAAALQIHLTDSERKSIHQRSTGNLDAYEFYLRGRHHYNMATAEDNRLAESMLRAAIKLDPQFAAAHSALSETLVQRFYNWFDRDRKWLTSAEDAVHAAKQINDQLPEVHCTLGMLLYLRGDYKNAMEEMQKAIRLDPHYALAHDHTGEMYLHTGELEKAILAFHTELRINPDVIYPYFYLVWIHSLLGDFRIARDILDQAKTKHSGNPLLLVLQGIEASYEGRLEEAEQFLQAAIAQTPGNSFATGRLAVVYAEMKFWEEAFRMAEKATEEIDPLDHHAAFDRGCVLALFGNAVESLRWLQRAIDLGWRCSYHFHHEKNLLPIRKTAGFLELIARLDREKS